MDSGKWENVLIQWVNCLQLTNTIHSLDNLRDSDFLSSLIDILVPSYMQKSRRESLSNVIELIKSHYPNYRIQEEDIRLETILIEDMVELCSLLMHYSCIMQQKEMLLSPLCSRLSPSIQLSIRTFLEKIDSKVTEMELKKVISEAEKSLGDNINPSSSYYQMPIGDSPLVDCSPLQNFLRAPNSRISRLLERDREMKALRAELEVERYEKTDLQEELKEHKERINKLGTQMKEKCKEISKLRTELYAMENKTPPHTRKFEFHDIERHLRSEIVNLEHYVTQLRTEQDELQDEKEKLVAKLKNSNEEVKIWQQKAVTFETTYDELSDNYKLQEQELGLLRTQCNELSALLDELRSARHINDDSYVEGSVENKRRSVLDCAPGGENLACAVVDLQLKEVENENVELQVLLKETVQKGNVLQEELHHVKSSYEDLNNNYKGLQSYNDELLIQITKLSESQLELKNIKEQLNAKVSELLEVNDEQSETILSLHSKLDTTTVSLKQCEDANELLRKEIKKKQLDYDEINKMLTERDNQISNLQREADTVQYNYEEVTEKFKQTVFDLECLQKKYTTLNNDITVCLCSLEKLVYGYNKELINEDKCLSFNRILSQLQNDKLNESNEKSNLQDVLAVSEQQILVLRQEILHYSEQEKITLEEKDCLRNTLKSAESNGEYFKKIVEEKADEISRLTNIIHELNLTIQELSKLKDVIVDREEIINTLNKEIASKSEELLESNNNNETLSNLVKSLGDDKLNLEKSLDTKNEVIGTHVKKQELLDKELKQARDEIDAFREMKTQLLRENLEKEKIHLESIHTLNTQIQEYIDRITCLEKEFHEAKQERNMKVSELQSLEKLKNQIEVDYEITKADLFKKNELTLETMRKLEIELRVRSEERDNLSENLSNLTSNNTKMLQDKEIMSKEIDGMKIQLQSYLEQIRSMEEKCTQKDTVMSENNMELLNTKLELEAKKEAFQTLQETIDKLNIDATSYIFCIKTLESQCSEFNTKISELNNELNVLNSLKVGLEMKNKDLEVNTENIIARLSAKNDELHVAIDNLEEYRNKKTSDIQNLNTLLDQANEKLAELSLERDSLAQKCDSEVSELKNDVGMLRNEISELHEKELDYIQDINNTKDELNNVVAKYTDNLLLLQEIKSENKIQIDGLTENLHSIIYNYNELDSKYQENRKEFAEINKQLKNVECDKIALEVKIIDQKKKYEQEIELTNEQYANDVKNLNSKQIKFETALEKAKKDLEKEMGLRYRLENDIKRLQLKLNSVHEEKTDLLKNIDSLEKSKLQLQNDYESLQMTYERYILDSESNLQRKESDLQKQNINLQGEITLLKNQISYMENKIKSIKSKSLVSEQQCNEIIKKKEGEMKELLERIVNYENSITKINNEQTLLEQQLSLEKTNNNDLNCKYDDCVREYEQKLGVQEKAVSKLKCAYDILQTGKDKLVLEYQTILDAHNSLNRDKGQKAIQLQDIIDCNNKEIGNLQQEIEGKNTLLVQKEKEISETTEEVNKLKLVLEAKNSEVLCLEEQLSKIKEMNKSYLVKIEEENMSKISEMSSNFEVLTNIHDELIEEYENLIEEKANMKAQIEEMLDEKATLEKIISEDELVTNDYKEKLKNIEGTLTNQEQVITNLEHNLQETLSELEESKNEKVKLQTDLDNLTAELEMLKRNREEILESQAKIIKDTENNILKAHAHAIEVKNDLLKEIEDAERQTYKERDARKTVEELLRKEIDAKEFLTTQVLQLNNEKLKYSQIYTILRQNIISINDLLDGKQLEISLLLDDVEEHDLTLIATEIEMRISKIFEKNRELSELMSTLEADKAETIEKLELLNNEKRILNAEKERLLNDYNIISSENNSLLKQHKKERVTFENLQLEFTNLKTKYEDSLECCKEMDNLKMQNDELQQKMLEMKDKNSVAYSKYQAFLDQSKSQKILIEKIIKERNSLEVIINDLKQRLINIQIKFLHVSNEAVYRQQFEQKDALEIIVDDIQRQFHRYSKIAYNLNSSNVEIFKNVVEGILCDKRINTETLTKELNINEVDDKIEELKDRATNTLDEMRNFENCIENILTKPIKVLKENALKLATTSQSDTKKQEEEWKRKYNLVKQKLTLTENVKQNYEKKLKQLREENKKLSAASKSFESEIDYKVLLQQHLTAKDEYEKAMNEKNNKYLKLLSEYEEYKKKVSNTDESVHETSRKLENEVRSVREAYGKLMSDKSKLDLDNMTLRNLLDDRNAQLGELTLIKEAYERLLEENNKLMNEVDTLKYKRTRDKDEFLRLLKKEKENTEEQDKKIQDIRNEYEEKLDKMKAKMVNLYKEEVQKEMQNVQTDNTVLLHTLQRYKTELEEAKQKIASYESTRKQALIRQNSQESLSSLSTKSASDFEYVSHRNVNVTSRDSMDARNKLKKSNTQTIKKIRESLNRGNVEDRRCATMPRGSGMDVIEEVRICRRTSINSVPSDIGQNLEMEDEGELFTNKYLSHLKEGKCIVPSGRESNASRVSELAWRNSLCPPHLKSSYPAEFQFTSPTHFKEDEIKTGAIDFDDSMSTKLLPGEKPRRKDAGTTSYKKPGPPTPSKHGGRLSLQGSDYQKDVLKEINDSKTPKRPTPNRLKALFMGRSTSVRDNSENQPVTPRPKRLSNIFRKPR